jgi:hypothetical protein
MSIKVSLPLLDAIVAMKPGEGLASGLCRETASFPLVSYEFAESPVRYFGIDVDDALEIAEQMEVQVRPRPLLPAAVRVFGVSFMAMLDRARQSVSIEFPGDAMPRRKGAVGG